VRVPLQLYHTKANKRLAAGSTIDLGPGGLLAEFVSGNGGLSKDQIVRVHLGPPAETWPQLNGFFDGRIARLVDGGSHRCGIKVMGEPPEFLYAPELIGTHPTIVGVKRTLLKIARHDVSVLVRGESGTGKNVAAALLHAYSPRAARPFVRVNCPSIPESLLESQMFGHDRGAFTDAKESRPGLFRVASRGTVVLDEISAVPLSTQAKLLQVIEEKRFLPVGGKDMIKVDVRLIATTNDNLERKMREGAFREDLFYRLNEMVLVLPPLRERASDVLILSEYFLHKYCKEFGKEYEPLDKETAQHFMKYSWPGNVRELENTIKRGVVIGQFETARSSRGDRSAAGSDTTTVLLADGSDAGQRPSLSDVRMNAEREALIQALGDARYDRTRAAALLGISYRTLLRRMKRHKIQL
jgi:transcriptional regulator with PAS, ATPase and Fis domain